jgi:hypothetical protein
LCHNLPGPARGHGLLAGLAVSIVAIVLGGNPGVLLIRMSFLTGALGVACFASLLLFPRPLIFYFGRYFETGDDPAKVAVFKAQWQSPYFRHVVRLIMVVWGVAYTGEFLLRVVMVSTLPIPIGLAVSPVVLIGISVATLFWTFAYVRWARQRDKERHGEWGAPPATHRRRQPRGAEHCRRQGLVHPISNLQATSEHAGLCNYTYLLQYIRRGGRG